MIYLLIPIKLNNFHQNTYAAKSQVKLRITYNILNRTFYDILKYKVEHVHKSLSYIYFIYPILVSP